MYTRPTAWIALQSTNHVEWSALLKGTKSQPSSNGPIGDFKLVTLWITVWCLNRLATLHISLEYASQHYVVVCWVNNNYQIVPLLGVIPVCNELCCKEILD